MTAIPATPPESDADVIALVLAGDRDAFATLVRRHNQRMYRACRAVLRDEQEAEDAVQAAWIKVYSHLASFRGDAAFTTWITRIAVREASARKRRDAPTLVAIEEVVVSDEHESPADSAYTAELGRIFERRLDELPDGLRSVVLLRDVLELDTAETAECLGIREEAVRVRLHRARHALAEIVDSGLAEAWRFDGDRCARVTAAVLSAIRA
jgi:RNA polymerase sigma-70 factor (ECF subfamily)